MPLLFLLAACSGFSDLVDSFDSDGDFFCEEDMGTLPSGFFDELVPYGCRMRIAAPNEQASVLLVLDVPVFADALSGEPVSADYTLPDDDVRLEVQTGCALDHHMCDDAGAEPIVSYTFTPTEGTVSVSVAPDDDGDLRADVMFAGIALEDEYGDDGSIEAGTFEKVKMY